MAETQLETLAKTDRNPIQEQQYQNLLTQSGIPFTVGSDNRASVEGFGTGGNNTNTPQFQYAADNIQAQQAYKNAIAPAVKSLQDSIPEVKTEFDTQVGQVQAEKDPLIARYKALIDQINGNTQGQVNDTTRVANQEFGKRGITGSSTYAQEEILRRTQPIQQAGEANVTNTTLDREEKLKGLDDTIANLQQQKVKAERDITNTIAQIQAQSGQAAAAQAYQMYQLQHQETQAELDRAIQSRLATVAETNATTAKTAASAPNIQSVQGGLYDTTNNRWIVPPKETSGSGTGTDITSILNALNGNSISSSAPYVSAKLSNDNSVQLRQDSGGGSWEIIR